MQREMEQTYLRQKQDLESRGQKQVEQMQGHIVELQTANRVGLRKGVVQSIGNGRGCKLFGRDEII